MGKYSVLAVAIIIIASGPAWASKIIENGHCVIDYDWNASNFFVQKAEIDAAGTCQIANDGRASHSYRALKTGGSITAKENRSSGGVS